MQEPEELKDRLIYYLAVLIVSGAGMFGGMQGFELWRGPEVFRPNPWTSIDAEKAHAAIDGEIDKLQQEIKTQADKCAQHRDSCEQRVRGVESLVYALQLRVETNATRVESIRRDVEALRERVYK